MTEIQFFEPEGRRIPFVEEGDGPVKLVLVPERGQDALGVVGHYLAEEAGFHVVRIGYRAGSGGGQAAAAHADDVLAGKDHHGLDHTWIGGHGFGGAHHERANGLLLLGVEDVDIPLAPVIPVLIVQGADDDVNTAATAERLQATAPERASVKTLAGQGHLFPATDPIETAVAIEEYLDWD